MSRTGPKLERPVVLAMVGLPARGKTFIARRIERYLSFAGYAAKVFNVGSYRREHVGSHQPHSFFDPKNPEGRATLSRLAVLALEDTLRFLRSGGDVALYDATNSTRARRDWVRATLSDNGIDVVFIESVCDDPSVIDANVRATKARSPDYQGMDPEEAVQDFRARIAHYEEVYEMLSDDEGSYIRILDVGEKLVLNRVQGYLPARLVPLLLSLHVVPRPLYLTRHGESLYNVEGRIGGDSGLSASGRAYAQRLGEYLAAESALTGEELTVWTSTLRRTIETASATGLPSIAWRALDEIDAGVCDGMTYDEVRIRMPGEWAARATDKLRYRYPRGESYEDVIQRLDPMVIEIERARDPLVVVAHQAVLRALYAYLKGIPSVECPTLDVPLHTVIRITPTAYGCDEERIDLGPDSRGDAPRSMLPPPVG